MLLGEPASPPARVELSAFPSRRLNVSSRVSLLGVDVSLRVDVSWRVVDASSRVVALL